MAARKRILLRADHSRLSAATARTTTATATAACRSQSSRRWSRTVLATLTTMGAVMAASLATAWVPLLLSTPPTHRAPSRRTPLSSGSTTSASSGSVRRGTFGQQESSIRETTTSIASATTTIDSATVGGEQTPAQTTGTDPVLSSPFRGALSLSMAELSDCLGGNGRAKLVWDCYKHGVDPALYFATTAAAAATNNSNGTGVDCPANPTTSISTIPEGPAASSSRKEEPDDISLSQLFPGSRRSQRLGSLALQRLETLYADYSSGSNQNNSDTGVNRDKQNNDNENPSPTHRHRIGAVQGGVATLSHVSQSQDGTTKLLLTLHDDTAVETVIIPWNGIRSTLCISSQVGCRQACTFCATGRMGRVRSLTTDEILAQMFFALQTIRRRQQGINNNTLPLPLPPITNIVFMGMGEPADNADAVIAAVVQLTTREFFQLSATKVTVSTVAPTPAAFCRLASAPCVLAWSVHAARDELRRKLVPTTKYTMIELRQGLIDALLERPPNFRTTMLEVALIDGINDSLTEAEEMAEFARGIVEAVPGSKLIVNLIPWNDIGGIDNGDYTNPSVHPLGYRRPDLLRVLAYQRHMWSRGIYTHVRATRGDDESAACGQLVTQKMKRRIPQDL